jgi:hypothetical protein
VLIQTNSLVLGKYNQQGAEAAVKEDVFIKLRKAAQNGANWAKSLFTVWFRHLVILSDWRKKQESALNDYIEKESVDDDRAKQLRSELEQRVQTNIINALRKLPVKFVLDSDLKFRNNKILTKKEVARRQRVDHAAQDLARSLNVRIYWIAVASLILTYYYQEWATEAEAIAAQVQTQPTSPEVRPDASSQQEATSSSANSTITGLANNFDASGATNGPSMSTRSAVKGRILKELPVAANLPTSASAKKPPAKSSTNATANTKGRDESSKRARKTEAKADESDALL